jgi:hypothetical protein
MLPDNRDALFPMNPDLSQIVHWDVGRASARHVGLKPDLQRVDFVMPQRLMDNLGLFARLMA